MCEVFVNLQSTHFFGSADEQDKDPYWAVIWASAVAMSELLMEEPQLVRGKRVAEVGCGLGIAGIASAFAGMSRLAVVFGAASAPPDAVRVNTSILRKFN